MPLKIKRAFEHEYGKSKGDKIFYAWQNKHRIMGVNLNKKVSPSTYPVKIANRKVMGVELKKSAPIKPVKFKGMNLFNNSKRR